MRMGQMILQSYFLLIHCFHWFVTYESNHVLNQVFLIFLCVFICIKWILNMCNSIRIYSLLFTSLNITQRLRKP